jgi:hypothetical protein
MRDALLIMSVVFIGAVSPLHFVEGLDEHTDTHLDKLTFLVPSECDLSARQSTRVDDSQASTGIRYHHVIADNASYCPGKRGPWFSLERAFG